DVELADLLLAGDRLQAVADHRLAEGAAGGDRLRLRLEELERALHVHAVLVLLLHPHLRAAGAAAEALLTVPPLGLDQLDAGDALDDVARRLVDVVVTAEVAGVVVDDLAL